jgi:DNA repair exonuclease SbcCD ATPase subunit
MPQIYLSIIEIAVLVIGALVLGLTIHFFIVSRRSLRKTLQETDPDLYRRSKLYAAQPVVKPPVPEKRSPVSYEPEETSFKKGAAREDSVEHLKSTILQQQKLLNGFLRQVEEIEQEGRGELELTNKELLKEIEDLEARLEKKQASLEDALQQAAVADRMAEKIEEVYKEFDILQDKMSTLEAQASKANNYALELEDTRQAYEQVHKDLQRKNEKMDEMFRENQRLQQQVNELEDKFAEANLHRQQLQKKVQFLQDLNTDLQSVSDTNKKLQTELRRVSELESMLNMISEERDYLLRRQQKK